MTCKCLCCILKNLIDTIKGINVSCNIPDTLNTNCTITNPVEITGNLNANCNINQPLEISGTLNTNVNGNITADIPNPISIIGTINTVSTDACAEAMAKILSQSTSFRQIVFKNDEQYGNVTNLSVNGSIVSFTSQGQTIQTVLCNIEFVVL